MAGPRDFPLGILFTRQGRGISPVGPPGRPRQGFCSLGRADGSLALELLFVWQGRRKQTTAIDIFGLLFDNEGFACLSTALSADVKGSPAATVEINIPKGESKTVSFYAAVQSRSPRPFRFGG